MVAVAGEHLRSATQVVVDVMKGGNLGVGGTALTVEDVEALAAGNL